MKEKAHLLVGFFFSRSADSPLESFFAPLTIFT